MPSRLSILSASGPGEPSLWSGAFFCRYDGRTWLSNIHNYVLMSAVLPRVSFHDAASHIVATSAYSRAFFYDVRNLIVLFYFD